MLEKLYYQVNHGVIILVTSYILDKYYCIIIISVVINSAQFILTRIYN